MKITVKTSRNAKGRTVSEARETQRGEHERGFPRSRVPEETTFWSLSHTHTCTHCNTERHTCTLIAQNELTSKINELNAGISICVRYILQRIGVQMPPYMEQLWSLGW